MPYKFTWQSRASVWVQFSGLVTFDEAVRATDDLYSDSRSTEIEYVVWDFTAIDDFLVEERDVEEIAYTDYAASVHMKPMKLRKAAFVISDPRLMRLGEQYVTMMNELRSPWTNRLFARLDDARKWAEARG